MTPRIDANAGQVLHDLAELNAITERVLALVPPATLCACGLDMADYHGQCPWCDLPEFSRVCTSCLNDLDPNYYSPDEETCDRCVDAAIPLRLRPVVTGRLPR